MNEINTAIPETNMDPVKKDNSNLLWGVLIIIVGLLFMSGIGWTYFKSLENSKVNPGQGVKPMPAVVNSAAPSNTVMSGETAPSTTIEEQVMIDDKTNTKNVGTEIINEIDAVNGTSLDTTFSDTQMDDVN